MTDVSMVGTAASYDDLRKLIAARRKELGLSQLAVDEIACVQGGYTGKIECGARHFGDMSLGAILGALGLTIGVVRSAGTHAVSCEAAKASIAMREIHQKKRSAKGGRARAANLTGEQRRASARHAAKARWRDWRAVKAAKAQKEKRTGKKGKRQ